MQPRVAGAGRARALDEAARAKRPEFRAHDARRLHPSRHPDQHDQQRHRRLQHARRDHQQRQPRHRQHGIGAAHQHARRARRRHIRRCRRWRCPTRPRRPPTAGRRRARPARRTARARAHRARDRRCRTSAPPTALRGDGRGRADRAGTARAPARPAPRRPGSTSSSAGARITSATTRGSTQRVRDVGDDVEHDDRRRREHQERHQHGVVAARERLGEEAAEPGPGEHALGDDRAGDEQRGIDHDDREHRTDARCAARDGG